MSTFTVGQKLTAAQMNQIGDDTGWVNLSLASGFGSGSVTPQWRRIGTTVKFRGSISTSSGFNGQPPFTTTLPPTPGANTQVWIVSSSSGQPPGQIFFFSGAWTIEFLSNTSYTFFLDGISYTTD